MLDNFEILEKELYEPVRKISQRIAISSPEFYETVFTTVENFLQRHPKISTGEELYERAVAHLYGYLIGRDTEREKMEIIKLGADGIKFVVSSYLKFKELKLKEKQNEQQEK